MNPRLLLVAALFLLVTVMIANGTAFAGSSESAASAKAFRKAYDVLLHPRCVNCHPAGNQPLVGDQSEPHPMNIKRGPEGMGENGMRCGTCHQDRNLSGMHMPPGAPGWQLPTKDMPMVFQTRTPKQLCEQMKDPAKNGNRTPEQVLEHVREAPLVLWGWNPGDGRAPVPVSHKQFVKYMTDWVKKGAACPQE